MKELLVQLKISDVQWNDNNTKVINAKDGTKGYIITKVVEKNGRPVSFVFSGEPPAKDGSDFFLDVGILKTSVNSHMLEKGLAYPTYYTGLYNDLRSYLSALVMQAKKSKLGLWQKDQTNSGFSLISLKTITDDVVILPKLFRRLVAFLGTGQSVDGFIEYMKTLNEKVFIIDKVHFTHFDNIIEVNGNSIKMVEVPENLIFQE